VVLSASSRRRLRLAGALLGAAVVGGGAYAALSQAGGSASPALTGATGRAAPGFSLPELAHPGRSASLSQWRGHDVVLNFWASWCLPCQAEMPVLEEAQREHPQVRFVGIDTNDTLGAARAFLGRVPVSYLILYDPNGTVASAYGLLGLPTTVFVSPRGTLLGRHDGQLDAATLAAALRQAFGAAAG
jgi:thiol-disulfide isomerase/thioredoxin